MRCFTCDRAATRREIDFDAHLHPRTEARGGPLLIFDCPGCGAPNLVERNAAGEVLLSPPLVRGHEPPELRGAPGARARAWLVEHRLDREAFFARKAAPPTELPETGGPVAPDRATDAAPDPDPEEGGSPPLVEVDDLLTAYRVLELELTATPEEIRKSYRRLARKCHPDRVAGLDEEIRAVAERKFRRLRQAYDLIGPTDPPPPADSRS